MGTSNSMNEFVRCTGRQHDIVFWAPVLLVVPLLLFSLPSILAISIAAVVTLFARVRQESTKIVITNKRAIIKRGMRRIVQMNIDQVESVDVVRPYLGVMLNYGTVIICGSGGRKERVNAVADPMGFLERCG
jgi:hypothetical protein